MRVSGLSRIAEPSKRLAATAERMMTNASLELEDEIDRQYQNYYPTPFPILDGRDC